MYSNTCSCAFMNRAATSASAAEAMKCKIELSFDSHDSRRREDPFSGRVFNHEQGKRCPGGDMCYYTRLVHLSYTLRASQYSCLIHLARTKTFLSDLLACIDWATCCFLFCCLSPFSPGIHSGFRNFRSRNFRPRVQDIATIWSFQRTGSVVAI